MTGFLWLDWLIISASLFNTLILFWLGFNVLFTAEKRRTGVWVASLGMITGGVFFLIHSVIAGEFINISYEVLNMLWKVGCWHKEPSYLQKRHRFGLAVCSLIFLVLMTLLLVTNTLPEFNAFIMLNFSNSMMLKNQPLILLMYPPYIILAMLLAIDALRFPGSYSRPLGNLARKKARPWLFSASFSLLAVSFLVSITPYLQPEASFGYW